MKKYISIFLFLFATYSIHSQNLEGNYKEGADSLSISGGKAVFNVSGFGALSTRMVGEGKYEYFDNFLLINTEEYSGQKTRFEPVNGSKKDSTVVRVVGLDNYAIRGALTEFLSESDKAIRVGVTDDRGRIIQPNDPKIRKIKVSNLGYQDIVFDAAPGKDFLVKLAGNNVIENQTVVFKINEEDEETISIILLSDDFDPGKDRTKSLDRLNKRAQKSNVLPKRLKKEYIPVYGR
ncbi:MAG: hypothetical protein Q4G48_06265 [Bacteroidia bacterium]|nr:hypothetical protein [Bacteroidia bacterium]